MSGYVQRIVKEYACRIPKGYAIARRLAIQFVGRSAARLALAAHAYSLGGDFSLLLLTLYSSGIGILLNASNPAIL